jgi:hypothetical protein
VVVIIGDFTHEGLSAKIESLGFRAVNKRLRSTPRNWTTITNVLRELNDAGQAALVFSYVSTPTLLLMAETQYDDVRAPLVEECERAGALFFVYEDNLEGKVEPVPWEVTAANDEELEARDLPWRTEGYSPYLKTPAAWLEEHADIIDRALTMMKEWAGTKIELVPFRKRSDVTIRLFEALEDAQGGVFLRLYVPHGRYQSEQFETFVSLFTRYLREVERKEFSVDVHRTSRGTTYIFKGRGDAHSVEDLREALSRFDAFLDLTATDIAASQSLLAASGMSRDEVAFLATKYAQQYRRIHLDTKQEYERKCLALKHEIEADLLERAHGAILPVPEKHHVSSLVSVIGNTAPVTIHLGPGAVAINSQVKLERVLAGVEYSKEDREILQLIERLPDDVRRLELRSDLERLNDPATSPEEQRTAVQKLKTFLYKSAVFAGKKVEELGTQLLIKYLESKIGTPGPGA